MLLPVVQKPLSYRTTVSVWWNMLRKRSGSSKLSAARVPRHRQYLSKRVVSLFFGATLAEIFSEIGKTHKIKWNTKYHSTSRKNITLHASFEKGKQGRGWWRTLEHPLCLLLEVVSYLVLEEFLSSILRYYLVFYTRRYHSAHQHYRSVNFQWIFPVLDMWGTKFPSMSGWVCPARLKASDFVLKLKHTPFTLCRIRCR